MKKLKVLLLADQNKIKYKKKKQKNTKNNVMKNITTDVGCLLML